MTIAAGLHWARIPLPMELAHINVWLMEDDAGWTLVDTGMAADPCREAWGALERELVGTQGLRRIFITHDHPDHMGLARWLQERHGAEVWMSAVAHESVADISPPSPRQFTRACTHSWCFTDSSPTARRRGCRRHATTGGSMAPRRSRSRRATAIRSSSAVASGTSSRPAGTAAATSACTTPPGGLLVSGDQVLPAISPNVSVVSSRPEADPLREFLASLARLEQCAEDTVVLPSHGRPFRGLHRRIADLRAHHQQQLASLREACTEPRTAFELLPVMFGRPLRGFHRMLAMGEAVAHLHYLEPTACVERSVGGDGVARFVAA